ncbi:unnamed protein product, partial [Vitis vinifera]
MADSDNDSGGAQNNNSGGNVNSELSAREQDRLLPIANVSRIMKKALPANAKISKDAKETVQDIIKDTSTDQGRIIRWVAAVDLPPVVLAVVAEPPPEDPDEDEEVDEDDDGFCM